ncbi:hypothetical protein [Clostridium sp.]|uniref:hypothetical protein n=1 Tax=Clostridium sp. TaxID=1506 RepID=UPI001A48D3A8|nr:hypothetical protein [Clostridium sp.]MBK5242119.1 hypothetical protein [Clostridium sp.]
MGELRHYKTFTQIISFDLNRHEEKIHNEELLNKKCSLKSDVGSCITTNLNNCPTMYSTKVMGYFVDNNKEV